MNPHARRRHAVLAIVASAAFTLFACSEDGDPGTPAGGLQLGQGANGQGIASSENNGEPTDPEGGTSSKGGTGGTGANGGTGGTGTGANGGTGGTGTGADGGTAGTSSKGGSGGTSSKGGSGGTSSKGGSGGTSSKGGSGGTSSKGGSGGTGGNPDFFSIADFFTAEGGAETVCSDCLRTSCASEVGACGNLVEGGECYALADCISVTVKPDDTSLDCAFATCGAASPTPTVNDFLTCLGGNCAEGCAATPGFTSCPSP